MSFQAFRVNRVWVVVNNSTHEQVGPAFPTQTEADRYVLELWHDAKPETSLSEPVVWDSDDPTERLLAILDRAAA